MRDPWASYWPAHSGDRAAGRRCPELPLPRAGAGRGRGTLGRACAVCSTGDVLRPLASGIGHRLLLSDPEAS